MRKMKKLVSVLLVLAMLIGFGPISSMNLTTEASAKQISECSLWDVVEFGSYPQSRVVDQQTIWDLDNAKKTWFSYNYYSGNDEYGTMKSSGFMKYADITLGKNKYRAVTFSSYRPKSTFYSLSDKKGQQLDNGYYASGVYYFKFEPLQWRILDPSKGFLMCLNAIDSQPYQNFVRDEGGKHYTSLDAYASDWNVSTLMVWLNTDFYNTAFTENEQSQIQVTNNENKSNNMPYYDSHDSLDRIFPLSYFEVSDSKYGFNTDTRTGDYGKKVKATDYAECQGCATNDSGYCKWWLRTPYHTKSVAVVDMIGKPTTLTTPESYPNVEETTYGVVPALVLASQFKTTIHKISYDANGGIVSDSNVNIIDGSSTILPTPTRTGYTCLGWSTSSTATAAMYSCNSSYKPTANTTLYAVWKSNTVNYTVSYNANGGSVSPSSATVASGGTVTLPTPTRSGYTCLGWAITSTATSATYSCGSSYKPTANTTLYAVWKSNVKVPTFSLNVVSETSTSVVLSVNLDEGDFLGGTFKVKPNVNGTIKECTGIRNGSALETAKTEIESMGGVIADAASKRDLFAAVASTFPLNIQGQYFLFTFEKLTNKNITKSDFNFSLEDIESANVVNNLPGSTTSYTVSYNANGGSVSPSSATVASGSSVTLPTPTRSGYTCLGWATISTATTATYSCGSSYKPTANTTLYAVWKQNTTTNIYNLGEETYSFKNFDDTDSPGGHCFGMSATSSGYYLGLLNKSIIGGSSSTPLYSFSNTAKVKEPICKYQKLQGKERNTATIAGGTGYKYAYFDLNKDWNEVINKVKDHSYDNKGTLQVGFRNEEEGHAVNFLYYKVVDGQQRIYIYDNVRPDIESYLYKDSSGKVREYPLEVITDIQCVALRDMNIYFKEVKNADTSKYIYAESGTIDVVGATEYAMECGPDNSYSLYEVDSNVKKVAIIPLVDNATFSYLEQEYSFNKIEDGTVGEFTLADSATDSSSKAKFEITKADRIVLAEESVVAYYKNRADISELTSMLPYVESTNNNVVRIEGDEIVCVGKGSADVVFYDDIGLSAVIHVKVKYSFAQWMIIIFLFGWLWY